MAARVWTCHDRFMSAATQPEPALNQGRRSRDAHDAQPPKFMRRSDGRMIGGVAAGLGGHLGVQPLTVRVAFSLLSALSGFGLVLYLALWIFTPSETTVLRAQEDDAPAGIAAATRSGKRRRRTLRQRTGDLGQLAALVVLGIGVALMLQNTPFGISPGLFLPLMLATAGIALVWRTADEEERREMAARSKKLPWLAPLTVQGSWMALARVIAGTGVIIAGVVVFLVGQGQLNATMDALSGILVILVGITLIAGPWLLKMWRSLEAERHERIVSQERADVAAHLHDSVLQTLALIQKQAGDQRAVVTLARKQERDLRTWLYGDQTADSSSLAAALNQMAVEVEDAFGVPVEVVTVGDGEIDGVSDALIKAAREAAVNAAKHSGAAKIDIFAEVTDDGADVFVRDRGAGFDPKNVPDDRLGVRGSIIDRMERHGGSAKIRSAPGEGTEVHVSTRRKP